MSDATQTSDVTGRRVLVTGASRGFGFAVARELLRSQASVMLSARSANDLADARGSLVREFPDATVATCACDVSRPDDVAALSAATERELGGLDVLVCNAGIYGPKGPIESTDLVAWSHALAVNVTGVVACAAAFSELLGASARGKVVILSGGGATKPMPFLSAYAASKAAVVRFGETLAEEWKTRGIDVNMVAPGALNTRLLDEIIEAGPEAVGEAFYAASLKQQASGGTPMERGARLCAYLASRVSDGITGRLISAVWDPWEQLADHAQALKDSDIYTLRRIVPEDRGLAW